MITTTKLKRTICLVIPTLGQGGMERVMVELANFFRDQGHNVEIVCLFPSEIKYEIDYSIKVHMPTKAYYKTLFNKFAVLKYLFLTIKKIDPSFVLSFGEVFNPISIVVCKCLSYKIFISDRSNPLKKLSFFNRIIKKFTYPLADGLIAQTCFAKDIFSAKSLNRNIVNIPNPLRELGIPKKITSDNIILSVGRMIESKNHLELIRIFNAINNKAWKLFIIGGGGHKTALEVEIAKLDLGSNVFLPGPSDDVDKWLDQCDIFAFTSLSEGFPNALSEAVAFPVASIAYDCPAGPSEIIINNKNGILVKLNDSKAFENELSRLMNDKKLRDTLAGNGMRNREKFSLETIGRQYLDFMI